MVRALIDDNIAVIHIEKNVISENVNLLESKVNYAKDNNVNIYIFDFHNIEYICSSALGIIAQTLRLSADGAGKVYFCSMSDKLKMLFEVTKFLSIVSTANTVDEALAECK